MSVSFTGTWSGSFTSDGTSKFIELPAGWDSIKVINETTSAAAGATTGAEFYFRKGMTEGRGMVYNKTTTTNALAIAQIAATLGFYTTDTSVTTPGALVATTGITGANPPLVTTGTTTGLSTGNGIVRLFAPAGALQLGGMDFSVGTVVANTSFTLAHMPAIVEATPLAGGYRIVPYNPYFYPSTRYITKISQAAQAIVTLSVAHSYVVGQKIRLSIPTVTTTYFGMTELDGESATIVAVNATDGTSTNTITINIDTTGFTAFALPLTATVGFTPAMVIPYGADTAQALTSGTNMLADSVYNNAKKGVLLMPGTTGPAGINTNVISWVASKSWNV